jgi:hypothetical protein
MKISCTILINISVKTYLDRRKFLLKKCMRDIIKAEIVKINKVRSTNNK